MNWLKKLTDSPSAPAGLEWTLWRRLPLMAWAGTLVPLAALLAVHVFAGLQTGSGDVRWLQTLDYMVTGAVIFHWSLVATVAIGCMIVRVMKGPGYVADGYHLPHSDKPRPIMQTSAQAERFRADGSDAV